MNGGNLDDDGFGKFEVASSNTPMQTIDKSDDDFGEFVSTVNENQTKSKYEVFKRLSSGGFIEGTLKDSSVKPSANNDMDDFGDFNSST